MKKLIATILLLSAMSATRAQGQTESVDTTTFAGIFDNKEYNVYLDIDFYHNDVIVPGQEVFGEMAGFFGDKRDSRKWLFTSAVIIDHKSAKITVINDYGSEDLVATLTKQADGTYVLKQEKGSTLKIARDQKWVKMPKLLTFNRRKN
jgi:hypothetical protein